MTTIASQITSLTVVYSIVYSGVDQRKHQNSASLAFVRGIHRDRWIPRTKGQLRGKCFHLMTSSWHIFIAVIFGGEQQISFLAGITLCDDNFIYMYADPSFNGDAISPYLYILISSAWILRHFVSASAFHQGIVREMQPFFPPLGINSLAPRRPRCHFKTAIFKSRFIDWHLHIT